MNTTSLLTINMMILIQHMILLIRQMSPRMMQTTRMMQPRMIKQKKRVVRHLTIVMTTMKNIVISAADLRALQANSYICREI